VSKTAIITFQTALQGDNVSSWLAPFSYQLNNSPAQHQTVQLASILPNTLPIPKLPGPSRYVAIYPPSGSTNIKTIYQNLIGTQGWQIDPANPSWLSIPANGASSLIIVSTVNEQIDLYWF